MKKPSEETKILAHTECLLVWDRIAETGCCKTEAINQLFKEGKISQSRYKSACPFCEYFYNQSVFCNFCIWPGNVSVRCNNYGTPFSRWGRAHVGSSEEKEAAKAMLKFLLELDY